MSCKIFKILLTFGLIAYCTVIYGISKSEQILSTADSLFEYKQYTESLEYYESFIQQGFYSPRALTRIALIHEGLGNYTYALYYMDLYYAKIPDKSILKKMDELASRYNLKGYEYNDPEFFISLYHRHYQSILFAFLAIACLFLFYLFLNARQKGKIGLKAFIFTLILGVVYYLTNYDITPQKGIIKNDCIVHAAPSAGANVVETIPKGHRVNLLNHVDIWYEIKWNDKVVYVRESNLLIAKAY